MKKLLASLSLVALLVGCASRDNGNNGMGGTSDQYNNNTNQYNNNATHATGTDAAPNDATKDNTGKDNTGLPMAPAPTQ